MRLKIFNSIMAGTLGFAALAMVSGCARGDRDSVQYIDDQVTTRRVKSELRNNPGYKFEDVQVNTYRGVVQLTGLVPQPQQKQAASNLAKNVPGVLDVVDNIETQPQSQALAPTCQSPTGRPLSEQQPAQPTTQP